MKSEFSFLLDGVGWVGGWREIKCHFHFSTGGSNNKSCILYTAPTHTHTHNEILPAQANLRGRTNARTDRRGGDI